MINPRTVAQELAYASVATRANQLQQQQNDLDTESSALSTLEDALDDFQSAIDALDSDTAGPVVYSATSTDDSATISANSQAQPGKYTFYVDTLATAQQTTFSFSDGSIPSSGTFTITMGDSEMDIDLSQSDEDGDGTVTVSELADAINHSEDNPGVSATIVNTGGATTLMLTSEETGEANAFTVSVSGVDTSSEFYQQINTPKDLSTAQDALIYLGSSPDDGIPITSSDNTFDDLIPGVSITFTEASTTPMTFTVAEDTSASQEKVQTFVDAYNTLVDTLDSLTGYDSNGNAGVFAGDAGLSSLERRLNDITHATYGDVSILDYGIALDSDGHLEIDSDQFSEAMKENPEGLTSIFVGDDSMVAQMDSLLDTYLDSSDGIIAQRQSTLSDKQEKIDDQVDQLTNTYNTTYDRYLNEYTQTLIEITSMEESMAAFS
ncbi:flagellar hook-associated protein 2 [Leminorella grimontii]|uniref:Flagellar hook-associated protein 2 n=1 Tax=Leminorella grimontii TaxID=82981 RepID=A0AAV5N1Z5_9GAMM|nr:flagellar filament capping protein FliD [Leminorella grimontii]KFC93570.1 FliD family flagellar hook-associated protein [Leminorella grimontii ATCC 33999 = DSM 5078]GKX55734.1 flagellar hook-associated protein 2 [Leminorella grimontii]GKX59543.1 flagellar hook-associated protein 2 [Leminorella grimontii]VFS55262.1 Flagellar cap protein [Leminorella grimontii]